MSGGDNSTTVSPVSAGVQSYEPFIRKYAKQCGIGEYVELIKAVMMQPDLRVWSAGLYKLRKTDMVAKGRRKNFAYVFVFFCCNVCDINN